MEDNLLLLAKLVLQWATNECGKTKENITCSIFTLRNLTS